MFWGCELWCRTDLPKSYSILVWSDWRWRLALKIFFFFFNFARFGNNVDDTYSPFCGTCSQSSCWKICWVDSQWNFECFPFFTSLIGPLRAEKNEAIEWWWRCWLIIMLASSLPKKAPTDKKNTFLLAWLNTLIFLMVINHYTYIKPMISLQSPYRPSILAIRPSFLAKWGRPPKMAIFDDLKIEIDGQKKRLFPNPYWHVLFAKNGV